MDGADEDLPRPGLVGRLIRLGLAVPFLLVIADLGLALVTGSIGPPPLADIGYLASLGLFAWLTPVAVGELFARDWGYTPLAVVVSLALAVAGVGLVVEGTLVSTVLGTYLDIWMLSVALLMAPALILAAVLGTPGCEMRAYAHLRERIRGGDAHSIACRGWIDRFDHVRVFGW